MLKQSPTKPLTDRITEAKHAVDTARTNGDKLKIALAVAAMNDLLDRNHETLVTRNDGGG